MLDFWVELHPELRALALLIVIAAILGGGIVVADIARAMRSRRDAAREADRVIGQDQYRAESRSRLRRLQAKFRRSA